MTGFLLPQPSPEGIEKTKEIGRRKFGRELSDGEAAEILSRVIRALDANMRAALDAEDLGAAEKAAPLGYHAAWKRVPEGSEIELVPDPKVLPLVLKAFELRALGMPLRKLAEEMEAAGLMTKKSKRVGPTALMAILKDARYRELDATAG